MKAVDCPERAALERRLQDLEEARRRWKDHKTEIDLAFAARDLRYHVEHCERCAE